MVFERLSHGEEADVGARGFVASPLHLKRRRTRARARRRPFDPLQRRWHLWGRVRARSRLSQRGGCAAACFRWSAARRRIGSSCLWPASVSPSAPFESADAVFAGSPRRLLPTPPQCGPLPPAHCSDRGVRQAPSTTRASRYQRRRRRRGADELDGLPVSRGASFGRFFAVAARRLPRRPPLRASRANEMPLRGLAASRRHRRRRRRRRRQQARLRRLSRMRHGRCQGPVGRRLAMTRSERPARGAAPLPAARCIATGTQLLRAARPPPPRRARGAMRAAAEVDGASCAPPPSALHRVRVRDLPPLPRLATAANSSSSSLGGSLRAAVSAAKSAACATARHATNSARSAPQSHEGCATAGPHGRATPPARCARRAAMPPPWRDAASASAQARERARHRARCRLGCHVLPRARLLTRRASGALPHRRPLDGLGFCRPPTAMPPQPLLSRARAPPPPSRPRPTSPRGRPQTGARLAAARCGTRRRLSRRRGRRARTRARSRRSARARSRLRARSSASTSTRTKVRQSATLELAADARCASRRVRFASATLGLDRRLRCARPPAALGPTARPLAALERHRPPRPPLAAAVRCRLGQPPSVVRACLHSAFVGARFRRSRSAARRVARRRRSSAGLRTRWCSHAPCSRGPVADACSPAAPFTLSTNRGTARSASRS